ncbi:MAG: double-strand break repair helicase AddA [Paracoccus sp. (in: a-proteobacteria)]|uniref:double-strand break repair helicase AddA n=1 Tax=Paracoccus sp. TaxID=267 RepID=UPI0026E0D699|nr:double-strand break repair helicase AddA [Paracoccus sp. (in: a-proteobacteria)]MDO5611966.1 double-strand break repair helicase AddA [Paracoccus sp. (in: a-proteobacteria)]
MDEATRNQIEAADPARSTWLTANAGSGKTRVLTNRVARLLLRGAAPERILCLTYTKAAATEMQNRLLGTLGQWAMLPPDDLRHALANLGEGGIPDLAQARRLFARAIETPGGLKVQTIHSFCAGVLRRFPLEAGVPLGFTELDDRTAAVLRAEIVDQMAAAGDPVIADLTALESGDRLDGFLAGLAADDFAAPPDPAAIWAALDLQPGLTADDLLAGVFLGAEGDLAAALIPVLRGSGTTDNKLADALAATRWDAPGLPDLARLCGALLTGGGAREPFTAKIGTIPTKAIRNGPAAPYMDALDNLMRRVEAARAPMLGLTAAQRSLQLHRFAHAFTRRYTAAKLRHGWLDFDDLIGRTGRLLSDPAMALWVLWRLDGGIDHILVDEAQDTSPGQWQVIRRLTTEFTSGQGARDTARTLFVVGDPKQSIYSFQGADIAVFETVRDQFGAEFQAVQAPMAERVLAHSFRSSPAVLRLVDAVFAGGAAQGLGGPPDHRAFHAAVPGRVDIWPPLPKPDAPDAGEWWQPVDQPGVDDADTTLARAIARQIKAMHGTPFHSVRHGAVRRLDWGDFLILVQRRSDLFGAIIAACKAEGLPIAGADRLKLAAELAVRDIRAVLSVLATPEDDLSLASALKSPLFGLSEDELYRLAAGRPGYLMQALRASGHMQPQMVLNDLAGQADFLRPYDLIARLLIRHGGRARLIARLGPEAQEGIDELMSQALAYETVETPSLTGFLTWLSGDDVEVRRQVAGSGGGLIRVMTVHGAKGLEAPVVILPDTAKRRKNAKTAPIRVGDLTLWRGARADRPPPMDQTAQAEEQAGDQERRRLLYVALTRAESWLIVAAAGDTGAGLDSWHALVAQGAAQAGLDTAPLKVAGIGTGQRLSFGDWPGDVPKEKDKDEPRQPVAVPPWADAVPPRATPPPLPVAATALGGAKAIGGAGGDDPAAAMLYGTRLHLLLEHLPALPPEDRPGTARALLAGAEGGLPADAELTALLAEAEAVLTAPDLAAVMQPAPGDTVLTEVALTAPLNWAVLNGAPLSGTIDRLIVGSERVLAVDYKSNAVVPASPDAVPDGILRQMAAYRAALRLIWPGRRVESAILWTADRSLMPLPDALLDRVQAGLDPAGTHT